MHRVPLVPLEPPTNLLWSARARPPSFAILLATAQVELPVVQLLGGFAPDVPVRLSAQDLRDTEQPMSELLVYLLETNVPCRHLGSRYSTLGAASFDEED